MAYRIRLLAFLAVVTAVPALVGYLIVPGAGLDDFQVSIEREIAQATAAQQLVAGR